jgi:hypothetical protein
MAAFPHFIAQRSLTVLQCVVDHRARHKRKISLAPINSLPGKNCLVAAIRRCIIARRLRAERKNRKARVETETCGHSLRQDLASIASRPTTRAHRVV